MKLSNLLSLVAVLAVATSCDYQKNNTIKQFGGKLERSFPKNIFPKYS
jgi:hypothetical protein